MKRKGWYEQKKYIRSLNRPVAPRHHYVALKNKKRPELVDFHTLQRYKVLPKRLVNWSDDTGLSVFDETLHNRRSPYRNFDAEKVYLSPDEYISIQKQILAKRHGDSERLFWMGVNRNNVERLKKEILNGKEMPSFVIESDKEGNLTGFQEGRHRAVAMKELGVDKIPVWKMKKRYI